MKFLRPLWLLVVGAVAIAVGVWMAVVLSGPSEYLVGIPEQPPGETLVGTTISTALGVESAIGAIALLAGVGLVGAWIGYRVALRKRRSSASPS